MSSRWFRYTATVLLLTLGLGVPAQAKPAAAGTASPRQEGVLEELKSFGGTLFQTLTDGGPLCGMGYCPTPPQPPPPIHTMSIMVKPAPAGKG